MSYVRDVPNGDLKRDKLREYLMNSGCHDAIASLLSAIMESEVRNKDNIWQVVYDKFGVRSPANMDTQCQMILEELQRLSEEITHLEAENVRLKDEVKLAKAKYYPRDSKK